MECKIISPTADWMTDTKIQCGQIVLENSPTVFTILWYDFALINTTGIFIALRNF